MREIQPISGACVWHGREMASSSRWRARLSDAQLAEIERAVWQARARGLGWQTMTAEDFPLPSCAALAEDIRAELEDGSGIVLLQGLDPSRYSLDELKLLYAAISRQIGTFVYSNRAGEIMREIRDVGRDGGRAAVQRYGALPEREGAFLSSYARTLSNGSLRFHTDRCDVVALFCVRQAARGGLSQLCSSPAVHNAMLERPPRPVRRAVRGPLAQPLRRGGRDEPVGLPASRVGGPRRQVYQPLFAHLCRCGAAPA